MYTSSCWTVKWPLILAPFFAYDDFSLFKLGSAHPENYSVPYATATEFLVIAVGYALFSPKMVRTSLLEIQFKFS